MHRSLSEVKMALDDVHQALKKADLALNELDPTKKIERKKWRILPPFKGSPNSLLMGAQCSNLMEFQPYILNLLEMIRIQRLVQPLIEKQD